MATSGAVVELSAHRRDEYLQAARLAVDPARVQVFLDLTPGIALAEAILGEIDRNGNGSLSADEQQTYASLVLSALQVEIDGRLLQAQLDAISFPDVDAVRRGEGIIRLHAIAPLPPLPVGAHHLTFRNGHHREGSVYLANALVPESDRVAVTGQRRDGDQRELIVDYVMHGPPVPTTIVWLVGGLVSVTLLFVSLRRVGVRHVAVSVVLLVVLAADAIPRTSAADRAVAVTFDDLPATSAGVVSNDVASLEALTRKLLSAVRKHGIPAVGFVNESKLFVEGAGPGDLDGRTGLLRMWLDAGLELGNHTYSHRDLNTLPLDQFQADVLRGEAVTRGLLKEKGKENGKALRYFRHPFLHVGADLRTRRAFEAFLSSHGYTVAPVTVDNDDFVYAAAYANALRSGDTATATRIADDYLRYMEEVFSFFEAVSQRVTGREIRQVLLLHANALNADRFGALAEALKRRGYRFVSLAHALEDPAYRLPDEFVGAPSNSWFNHWEITAGRPPVPTPAPPDWISKRQ